MREDWYVIPARYALHMRADAEPVGLGSAAEWAAFEADAEALLEPRDVGTSLPRRHLPCKSAGHVTRTAVKRAGGSS